MTTINPDEIVSAWALCAYLYNTSGWDFAVDMFGEDSHPSYLGEYANAFAESPARAIGKLDTSHFFKLVSIAKQRHSYAGRQTLGLIFRDETKG